jgi:hypothetical protein
MLKERVFNIVLVKHEKAAEKAGEGNIAKIVKYNGLENKVVLR